MMATFEPPECPNVVKHLEWFEGPTLFILILERPMPCMDLYKYCQSLEGHLSESQARNICQVVLATKHCHKHGVLNLDIKQENVLVVWYLGVLMYVLCCDQLPFVNGTDIVSRWRWFRRGLSIGGLMQEHLTSNTHRFRDNLFKVAQLKCNKKVFI